MHKKKKYNTIEERRGKTIIRIVTGTNKGIIAPCPMLSGVSISGRRGRRITNWYSHCHCGEVVVHAQIGSIHEDGKSDETHTRVVIILPTIKIKSIHKKHDERKNENEENEEKKGLKGLKEVPNTDPVGKSRRTNNHCEGLRLWSLYMLLLLTLLPLVGKVFMGVELLLCPQWHLSLHKQINIIQLKIK